MVCLSELISYLVLLLLNKVPVTVAFMLFRQHFGPLHFAVPILRNHAFGSMGNRVHLVIQVKAPVLSVPKGFPSSSILSPHPELQSMASLSLIFPLALITI